MDSQEVSAVHVAADETSGKATSIRIHVAAS